MIEQHIQLNNIERMTFGKCPTCGATHGRRCDVISGPHMGVDVDGLPVTGVHRERALKAPKYKIVRYE